MSHVCRSGLNAGKPGNWHTDRVSTGVPANAHWQSYISVAGFQTVWFIKYCSSNSIWHGLNFDMVMCKIHFATWNESHWCWGLLRSPPAIVGRTFWCSLGTSSVGNGSGFGTQNGVGSVPDPSENPTQRLLVGQTRTRTRQPVGFARFGKTCRFESPFQHLGFHIYDRIQICYCWS